MDFWKIWEKSFLNALNAIMKGAAGKHGAVEKDDMHKRDGVHFPESESLFNFLTSVWAQ